jgi:hypothetical protein
MLSYYHQTQNFLQNYYNLSDHDVAVLLSKMPPTDVYQYIGHKAEILNTSIDPTRSNRLQQKNYDNSYWQQSYDIIKAEHWPACNSIEDFYSLPLEIQQECKQVHKFSPDIWFDNNLTFESFTKSADWTYDILDLIKVNHLILDNIDSITGKKVIDFCTHTGTISGLCLHHAASHVTFTEIRDPFLQLTNKRMELMGFAPEQYASCLTDIHDYKTNTELCTGKDTVILSGIIYHVHDHYSILESIIRAQPKSIIIETCHYRPIADIADPLIYWMSEETEKNTCNAYYKDYPVAMVGFPNLSWFNFTMNFFGYQESKRVLYDSWMPSEDILSERIPTITRSVQVFTK